jgi:hypothetical protein
MGLPSNLSSAGPNGPPVTGSPVADANERTDPHDGIEVVQDPARHAANKNLVSSNPWFAVNKRSARSVDQDDGPG